MQTPSKAVDRSFNQQAEITKVDEYLDELQSLFYRSKPK